MRSAANSLAGRVEVLGLEGLSYTEIQGALLEYEPEQVLLRGGRFILADAKWTEHPDRKDAAALARVANQLSRGRTRRRTIFCRTANPYSLGRMRLENLVQPARLRPRPRGTRAARLGCLGAPSSSPALASTTCDRIRRPIGPPPLLELGEATDSANHHRRLRRTDRAEERCEASPAGTTNHAKTTVRLR
ncbi:MAG: hypothetical protein JRI23_02400 [Deltaproteobacteria bacterium]|jgi:hypothetical protein|nr:hypothetical protein [Deltaproteobacteria bacterium]MBW2530337.1 hypothetical protein [Deltaproteobacteria bacterium]